MGGSPHPTFEPLLCCRSGINTECTSGSVRTGPTVKPSVSLLPPSSLQLSEGSASLLCLLSAYSPQGALVSWTVDGSVVKDGVVTSAEEQKKDGYTRSSTLTLSKALWEQGEEFVCGKDISVQLMEIRQGSDSAADYAIQFWTLAAQSE
ncbi:hypothetical protein QTP70_000931 [Hemibagrus guttatus]|uniref:Ig-like domain-containing protein n=1 Tax=Hemibagrus guttatus TaxID=175788 RepID=A0AAE0QM51_9TELE|nr:hypothetical protein QTP70_000931 [Hemibagrus guttatus]